VEIAIAGGVVAVACALLAGALGKNAAPSSFVAMLAGVGVPAGLATRFWWIVPCVESTAAAALLTDPGLPAAQLLTFGVFGCFCIAGLVAIRSGRSIACACFGAQRSATLGWQQVVQLVPVTIVLALLQRYDMPWEAQQGVGLTAAALAAAAVALGLPAVPLWREVRAMRLSLRTTRLDVRRLATEGDNG
jgi:hypothetical protein